MDRTSHSRTRKRRVPSNVHGWPSSAWGSPQVLTGRSNLEEPFPLFGALQEPGALIPCCSVGNDRDINRFGIPLIRKPPVGRLKRGSPFLIPCLSNQQPASFRRSMGSYTYVFVSTPKKKSEEVTLKPWAIKNATHPKNRSRRPPQNSRI